MNNFLGQNVLILPNPKYPRRKNVLKPSICILLRKDVYSYEYMGKIL